MKKINTASLPYIAAAFQASLYAFAGSVYFGHAGWIMGGIAGILPSIAMVYGASRISDVAKTRKRLSYAAMGALLVLSPIATAPAIYYEMAEIAHPVLRIMAALVWALLPDASIVLTGAIAGKSIIAGAPHNARSANAPSRHVQRSATRSAKSANGYPRTCKYCDAIMRAPQSVGAHMKKHHPEMCARRAYVANELVKQ